MVKFPSCVLFVCVVTATLAWDRPHVEWPGTTQDLQGQDVVVHTSSGTVRGKRQNWHPQAGGTIQQIDYFLGIPYAVPPIGELRFKAPRPVASWPGVLNATRFGAICPQNFEYKQMRMDEDCLTLNVFAPHKPESHEPWPVLVYIHGGSYRVGTGASYIGGPLAQREVIVVTINYRLGILGFISARNNDLPGNNGILDQIESLKWVNKNIAAFGGNPNNVTIFGNSAGGASVGILMVSPLAQGLFQQSIVQSGSPLSFWALHNDTVDLKLHTRQVAAFFKCTQQNFSSLVACLRRVPAKYLGECSYDDIPSISVSTTNFRPHVDDVVIPSNINELYRSGVINPARVMAGIVDREWSRHFGTLISDLRKDPSFDSIFTDGLLRPSFELAIQDIFERQFGWGETVTQVVIHEYTSWSNVDDPIENRENYITFMTDFGMLAPTVKLLKQVAKRNVPAYAYSFNHRSSADKHEWSSNAHLMELHYIFGAPFLEYNVVFGTEKDFTEEDKDMSRFMMELWSDFAKNGVPSTDWEVFTTEHSDYFAIGSVSQAAMAHNLDADGSSFWNELIPKIKQTPGDSQTHPVLEPNLNTLAWVLLVVCIVLLITVFSLVVLLYRRRHYRRSTNIPVEI